MTGHGFITAMMMSADTVKHVRTGFVYGQTGVREE